MLLTDIVAFIIGVHVYKTQECWKMYDTERIISLEMINTISTIFIWFFNEKNLYSSSVIPVLILKKTYNCLKISSIYG